MTEKGLRRSGYVPLAKADGASPPVFTALILIATTPHCTTIWQVLRTLRKKISCDHVGAGPCARRLNSHGRTRTNTDEHGRWAGPETRPYKSLRLCVFALNSDFGCGYAALCPLR